MCDGGCKILFKLEADVGCPIEGFADRGGAASGVFERVVREVETVEDQDALSAPEGMLQHCIASRANVTPALKRELPQKYVDERIGGPGCAGIGVAEDDVRGKAAERVEEPETSANVLGTKNEKCDGSTPGGSERHQRGSRAARRRDNTKFEVGSGGRDDRERQAVAWNVLVLLRAPEVLGARGEERAMSPPVQPAPAHTWLVVGPVFRCRRIFLAFSVSMRRMGWMGMDKEAETAKGSGDVGIAGGMGYPKRDVVQTYPKRNVVQVGCRPATTRRLSWSCIGGIAGDCWGAIIASTRTPDTDVAIAVSARIFDSRIKSRGSVD
ncbi:hypothetical protein B0H16DRAFT_1685981 [Mycena metata]|uniref:Uncharacterized protein n=1 Tax=Mycena metata TaxID=1033252 RepID=A0AAD7JQG0_9AGAR|nr:hypothetical protein B0H16DRAFT_1685981 [Mycena metata]